MPLRRCGLALAATLCLTLPATAAAKPVTPLGHSGRWITDSAGRVIVMHGLNFMDKRPPYLPGAIGLDDDDAAFMRAEGFNTVRLGVMPAGIEPSPGVYSKTYLDGIVATVRMLARHGLMSLVDFHQDFYNQRFGGQGMADWMVVADGLADLPVALTPNTILRALQPSGTRVWDNFWANRPAPDGVGLQDHYASDWAQVARRLRREPSVIGYDLMNEPWAGGAAVSCINVVAACPAFDKGRLMPFYKRVISAIRAVDRRTAIHYEPELLSGAGAGYDMGPTGDDNAVLSFHVYCVTYVLTQLKTPGCDVAERQTFANAEAAARRADDALLLTEFGSTPDTEVITRVAAEADRSRVGWLEWTYYSQPGDSDFPSTPSLVRDPRAKPEGANINTSYLGALSRAYPQAVAGTPRGWSYDPAGHRFELSYSTDRADGHGPLSRRTLTEIVIPRRQFPDGYVATVTGGTVVSRPGTQILKVARRPGATGVGVSVRRAR